MPRSRASRHEPVSVHGHDGADRLLGADFPGAVSALDETRVFGTWRKRAPADHRPATFFSPAFYPADHAHGQVEVCLLIAGQCQFSLAGRACILRTGDLVFLPPGVPHAESFVRPGVSYRLAWLILHPGDPCLQVTRYAQGERFSLEHRFSLADLPAEARERCARLAAWASAPAPPGVAALQEVLYTVGLALFRRVLAGGGPAIDGRARVVERTFARIRESRGAPPAVADLSRAAHLSPNYLTALFKAQTGQDLRGFLAQERIHRAETLLATTDLPIKAVASELGYSDPFTFSRAFKRITGRPPSQARDLRIRP